MRHVFRVNVAGQGHALYLCDAGRAPVQLPLDVRSGELPPDFIDAQNVVDDLLAAHPRGPYLYASGTPGGESFVLYGLVFDGHDQFGRAGITLVHGMAGHEVGVVDLVQAVTRVVSVGFLGRVEQLVQQMAVGGADVAQLLDVVAGAVRTAPASARPPKTGVPGAPIAAVTHDCSGSAVAWLAMAQSNQGGDRAWAINDTVLDDGSVATVSSRQAGPRLLLSDYLKAAVRAVDASMSLAVEITGTAGTATERQAPSERSSPAPTNAPAATPEPAEAPAAAGSRHPALAKPRVVLPDGRFAGAVEVRVDWHATRPGRMVLYGPDRSFAVRPAHLRSVVKGEHRYYLTAHRSYLAELFGGRPRAFVVLASGEEAREVERWLAHNGYRSGAAAHGARPSRR